MAATLLIYILYMGQPQAIVLVTNVNSDFTLTASMPVVYGMYLLCASFLGIKTSTTISSYMPYEATRH